MKKRIAFVMLLLFAFTVILFVKRRKQRLTERPGPEGEEVIESPVELKGRYSTSPPSEEAIAGDPLLAWPAPTYRSNRAGAWFSKDGSILTVVFHGSDEHAIEEYDVPKRTLVSALRSKEGKWPEDAGASDAESPTREVRRTPKLDLPSEIRATAWSPDGKKLAVVVDDGVFVWSPELGLVRYGGPPSTTRGFACSPSGRRIFTGRGRIVDLAAGRVTAVEGVRDDSFYEDQVSFRHDEAEVAVGYRFGGLHRYDATTGKHIVPPVQPPEPHQEFQVWAAQGDHAFAIRIPYGREYDVFDIESGKSVLTIGEIQEHTEAYAWVAERAADENRVAVKLHRTVRVFTLPSSTTPATLSSSIQEGNVRLDGPRLFISGEGKLERWDVETKRRTAYLALPYDLRRAPRDGVSHDKKRFLLPTGETASFEGSPSTVENTTLLRGKDGYSNGCFGPDDKTVAFAARDAIIVHRFADKKTLALYSFVVGSGVELLAMTPEGSFDGSDALLETVWFEHEGRPRRASSFPERRRRGLLEAFHRP